ncbi:MAG: hypothetical protein L0211_18465, partial [Planctomycetaceae bacterium]|nr:hypothetical protein [Planctomycetaceae bacterium]
DLLMYNFEPKQAAHVQSRLRRIVDLTVPNFSPELERDRIECRSNRVIPALLCPWRNDAPDIERHAFVLTRDISSDGAGLVLNTPFRDQELLLGFWLDPGVMPEPWLFLGNVQHLRKWGGGYWTLGVHLTEFAGSGMRGKFACLSPLLSQLHVSELVTN